MCMIVCKHECIYIYCSSCEMLWGRFSPVACKLCTKCFLLHHFLCIAAEIQHTSDHQSQRALAYVARWPIFQTLNITFGPSDLHMFAEDYCPKWPEWPCNGARLNHQGPKATLPEAWTRHLAVGRGIWSLRNLKWTGTARKNWTYSTRQPALPAVWWIFGDSMLGSGDSCT